MNQHISHVYSSIIKGFTWIIYKLLFFIGNLINTIACRPNGTIIRPLLNLADIRTPPSNIPVDGVKTSDHTVDSTRKLWFRLFLPVDETQSQPSLPVIIYFHGGGFVQYSPSTTPFHTLCQRMARYTPAIVISVNYRHAPEHKFPAQYDDGFDVVKFVDDEIKEKILGFPANADLGRCFLAGDSAGGNIAHHVAVRCAGYKFKEVRISGLIMIQPFFGGEERTGSDIRLGSGGMLTLKRTDFYWKAFLPNGSDRDHPAANVFGPRSEVDVSDIEYPPTIVIVGGLDLLQDWQRRYVDGLKRSGKEVELVEYPNVGHAFYGTITTEMPEYEMLIAQVGQFVEKQLYPS